MIQKCWNEEFECAKEVVDALIECIESLASEELEGNHLHAEHSEGTCHAFTEL